MENNPIHTTEDTLFGWNLRVTRRVDRISRNTLEALTGVSVTDLAAYESGIKIPSREVRGRLYRALTEICLMQAEYPNVDVRTPAAARENLEKFRLRYVARIRSGAVAVRTAEWDAAAKMTTVRFTDGFAVDFADGSNALREIELAWREVSAPAAPEPAAPPATLTMGALQARLASIADDAKDGLSFEDLREKLRGGTK